MQPSARPLAAWPSWSLAAALLLAPLPARAQEATGAGSSAKATPIVVVPGSSLSPTMLKSLHELFQESQKERKGITFFINGQMISGIVSKVYGDESVEIRNSTFNRIIIRLERVDAFASN